jgi:DNA-3-methyladenine glycosylase I
MSYCSAVRAGSLGQEHIDYHDREYGFPIRDDNALFERLILEINQAGLSWTTILRKKAGFQKAYDNFDLERVAAYTEADEARLLADAGIIRNRLKVKAASENARRVLEIRKQHGSFAQWLDAHHPREKTDWVKLFRKTFVFTGGEIVGEFLLSTGYLPGAHDADCPVYRRLAKTASRRRPANRAKP